MYPLSYHRQFWDKRFLHQCRMLSFKTSIGGCKGGTRDAFPLSGHFSCSFWQKSCQNNRFLSTFQGSPHIWEILDPSLTSATRTKRHGLLQNGTSVLFTISLHISQHRQVILRTCTMKGVRKITSAYVKQRLTVIHSQLLL